ncbi:MAG TPA: AAA family ATPase [Solirubrobacteraceae bacterium]|nr:AAA family ATPase [Solirubrobacteraceae bacterium]
MPDVVRGEGASRLTRAPAPAVGAGVGLLERDQEMAQLEDAISSAASGRGGLVLIEGSAGLGKSRMLRWTTERARERGLQVLSARSGAPERDFSFGVALQLFQRRLRLAAEGERAHLLGGPAALVRPLFSGEHWGQTTTARQAAQDGLFHGLLWLVANLADEQTLLLAIDDLHWTDEPSLRFLLYLARQVDSLPVAVVATRRPGAAGRLDSELAGEAATRRIRLLPLSTTAVSRLVAERLDHEVGPRFAASAHHATGGNPLLVEAMVQSLGEEQIVPSDDNTSRIDGLRPDAVRQHTLVRIARRGADAVALAAAAAVLGDAASIANAAVLAGLQPDAGARAADALAAADILTSVDPLAFAHPLVWGAVYEEIPPGRRGRWHARASRLLYDEAAPAELVCAQLLSASRVGEGWAAAVLREAADRALQAGNLQSVIRYLTRALEEPLERDARAQALVDLARAKAAAGEPSAEQDLERALPLLDQPRVRAQAHQTLGNVLYHRGASAQAANEFERALALIDDPDDGLGRELAAAYYAAASVSPDLAPKARARIEPLLSRAPGDEGPAERGALAGAAVYLAISGAPREQAIGLARRAWGDGQLLADEGPEGWAWSLVTGALSWTDECAATLEVSAAVIEQARQRGSVMAYATASFASVQPTHMVGRLSDAHAHAQAALDARRHGWRTYEGALRAVLAGLLIDLDQLEEADRQLQPIDDPGCGTPGDRAWAVAMRGRLRLLQARPREALADLLAGAEVMGQVAGDHDSLVPWRPDAALAAAQLGDREQAEVLLAQAAAIAERTGTPTHAASVLRARAQLEPECAVELLGKALRGLESSQARTERIRLQSELGAAMRRAGQRAAAREMLREALEQAHAIGARRIERRVREELQVAGARPRRLAFSGADALTASERRVAEMAAQGTGNREIAQALFVTHRTVEQHLYNAYKKLGISSRARLAEALAEPRDNGTG